MSFRDNNSVLIQRQTSGTIVNNHKLKLIGYAVVSEPLDGSVFTQLKIWYYMIGHRRCTRKWVIICVIAQGMLFYEHVHVIDEHIEEKRAQDGALGHFLWQGGPRHPCRIS